MNAPDPSAPAAATITAFLDTVYESAPDEVLNAASRILLNGLRACLAGVGESLPTALRDVEQHRVAGAAGQASVLFSGKRLPADSAALCNQQMWALLLLDDMEMISGMHPGGPAVTGALATAEALESSGIRVSGRRLLAAVVASVEVQIAVAIAASPEMLHERGFAPLSALAPLGATVAACVIASAPAAVARHALGISAMSGIGMWEMGGTSSAGYITASATRSGIAAFDAAKVGIEAPERAIDGDFGAFRAFTGKGRDVLAGELATLGWRWRTTDVLFQPYSGDTYSQAPVAAIAALRARARVGDARSADRIVVRVDSRTAVGVRRKFARHPMVQDPLVFNSDPQSRIAAAWLRGAFSYNGTFRALVDDAEVRRLRGRVEFVADPAITDMASAVVEIHFTDGSVEGADIPAFAGSAGNRFSDDALADVFREAAHGRIPGERAERIVARVADLVAAPSIRELLAEIGPAANASS